LSILGFRFEAYKTARDGYNKMQQLKVPTSWQEEVDLANLKCRSKPFSDKDGFQVLCNRCMTTNQLINHQGDFCTGCGQKFVRNMTGFDTLPLVEFVPPPNMPHKRVLECLRQDPPEDRGGFAGLSKPAKRGGRHHDGWQENGTGDEQTLTFNNNQEEDMDNDVFTQKMLEQLETQVNPEASKPVEVDERVLQHMNFEEVYIVDYSKLCPNMPRKFYRNMVPDVSITLCECCCKFFLQDEYEFAYIEKGHCPFCKNVEKDKGVKNVYGSLADMRS
jgi:intraflagellar transport protein 122